ncbi:hypothetical protein Pan216_35370 [Planctomycetes bacterium Pan216]|uniref:Uncharacterized protein n=1 Tax=Kolteria novifilia TaxID=2527975 RepID=A0A518B6S1_9BACT|nr:hypothetical protein Pan216_35370 [Planctomycetes bacterium Pan216]
MARKKAAGPNKSAFIREQLGANPEASAKDVSQNWAKQHRGTINATLFYQVKSGMGLSSGRRGRRKGKKASARLPRKVAAASGGGDYAKIEAQLDLLISQALELKDDRLATHLKQARRHASARLI